MDFNLVIQRALEIRGQYGWLEHAKFSRSWTGPEIALGLAGDVGDLGKFVMAAEGLRGIPNARQELAHELADCLWSILVLSHTYDIDLEAAFLRTRDELEQHIAAQSADG